MKKLLTTVLIGLLSLTAFAQYQASYRCTLTGKMYSIETTKQGKYLIIAAPDQYETEAVAIMVSTKDVEDFYYRMTVIYEKFLEWEQVAKENNVTDMKKELPFELPKVTIGWGSSQSWFAYKQTLRPYFVVLSDGTIVFSMSGKATASSNRYITQEYYFVVGQEDFKDFLDAINPENIAAGTAEKKEVDALFK